MFGCEPERWLTDEEVNNLLKMVWTQEEAEQHIRQSVKVLPKVAGARPWVLEYLKKLISQ